jgi:hypothetical protein
MKLLTYGTFHLVMLVAKKLIESFRMLESLLLDKICRMAPPLEKGGCRGDLKASKISSYSIYLLRPRVPKV